MTTEPILSVDRITLLLKHAKHWPKSERCRRCKENVRYWNGAGGNVSCACCVEGPEACDAIPMPDGVTVEDMHTLLAMASAYAVLAPLLREWMDGIDEAQRTESTKRLRVADAALYDALAAIRGRAGGSP